MRPTKGFGRLAGSLSSFWERDPRPRSAVLARGDLELPARILDAAADHRKADVPGTHGPAGAIGIDPHAIVADLEDEPLVPLVDHDVDRSGPLRVIRRAPHRQRDR